MEIAYLTANYSQNYGKQTFVLRVSLSFLKREYDNPLMNKNLSRWRQPLNMNSAIICIKQAVVIVTEMLTLNVRFWAEAAVERMKEPTFLYECVNCHHRYPRMRKMNTNRCMWKMEN